MINFKERYYKLEKKSDIKRVDDHPLETNKNIQSKSNVKQSITNATKVNYVDPLSVISPLENVKGDNNFDFEHTFKNKVVTDIEPWSSKRLYILTNYTTIEKLSIISSFLTSKPDEQVRILNKQSSVSIIEKAKSRLEQLDDFNEEVRETSNLSAQQFTDKLYELQNALKISWLEGHRVKTLQIVIQSTKLLSESNVIQFFPSKFVLVTDLVDHFGKFVFDRLKEKSAYIPRGSKVPIQLPDNFRETQVPESAKETARNWFYKVASIRELVARLYVEATLLPCYRFVDYASIPASLLRLVRSARGIGDPLLATYARSYIVRVGITIDPRKKDYIELAFDDTLSALSLSVAGDSYLRLFMPAVDWILSCLCASASDSQLDSIVSKIERSRNPLLLHSTLNSLSTEYIEKRTLKFAEMINNLPDGSYPKYTMYKQLGTCVSLSYSLGPDQAMQLMKCVWRYISKMSEPRHFIECVEAWAEFLAMNFDNTFVNKFISHVTKEMIRDNHYQEYYNHLQSILNKIMSYKCDFENLFSAPEFTQFLSLFDKEHVIIEVRQLVLDRFFSIHGDEVISDPVIIQGCMRLLKEMYDSLNSLSVSDNRRIVSKMILSLLNRIRFEGTNVEQELELLTQFRSLFGSMEVVIYNVIVRVNCLTMRVHSLRPNNEHNPGSASFVRACMAFNFITIPSIDDSALAIRLYATTAQVALVNGCLGQADACLKEAIHMLSQLDSIEPAVVEDLSAIIASTLLACPDLSSVMSSSVNEDNNGDQNQQMLYLVKGLVNAVNLCPVLKTDSVVTHKSILKGEIFIKILLLLSALGQCDYLYQYGKTDGNDRLYGGSEKFLQTISDIFTIVVTKIKSLKSDKVNKSLKEVLRMVITRDENSQRSVAADLLSDID